MPVKVAGKCHSEKIKEKVENAISEYEKYRSSYDQLQRNNAVANFHGEQKKIEKLVSEKGFCGICKDCIAIKQLIRENNLSNLLAGFT